MNLKPAIFQPRMLVINIIDFSNGKPPIENPLYNYIREKSLILFYQKELKLVYILLPQARIIMKNIVNALIFMSALNIGLLSAEELKGNSTKIERFQAAKGDVIIKGFEKSGMTMLGKYGKKLTVETREFIRVVAGDKSYGIVVEIKETSGSYPKSGKSFVDYDELDSLLKSVEYIRNVDKTASNLSEIEATFSTNGGLEVTAFTISGELSYAIGVGRHSSVLIYLNSVDELSNFKKSVIAAKVKIDAIK